MKFLFVEKSLEVYLVSKLVGNKDVGFKRVYVKSFNYKNWSSKGNYSYLLKVRNKYEDFVLEDDVKLIKLYKNGEIIEVILKNILK